MHTVQHVRTPRHHPGGTVFTASRWLWAGLPPLCEVSVPSMPNAMPPGGTPDDGTPDAVLRITAERQRWRASLDLIRQQLEDEPSDRAIEETLRLWMRDARCIADDVKRHRRQGGER